MDRISVPHDVRVAGSPAEPDRAAVHDVLERSRDRVESQYHAMVDTCVVTESDLNGLVATWYDMWAEIERAVSPELWAKVKMLSG